jgi:hypothetical protein
MHYVTHHFAHSETLARARRWLIQAGVAPDRILVHEHGTPRITVAAEPTEVDSIQMIVRIAGMNDPEGLPGFWDVPHEHPADHTVREEAASSPAPLHPSSFPLAWHAVDGAPDVDLLEEIELQRTYREMRP